MVSTVSDLLCLQQPTELELLVVVFDLTNFTRFARSVESSELFAKVKAFNELTARFISGRGGLVIKYLGDAGLCVFPRAMASDAIMAMRELKEEVDEWLRANIPGSQLAVNCHVGAVTAGPTPGFNGQAQIDVIGETVNTCFTMSQTGFVLSPQAFRALSSEARKHFHKYTPPITYRLSHEVR